MHDVLKSMPIGIRRDGLRPHISKHVRQNLKDINMFWRMCDQPTIEEIEKDVKENGDRTDDYYYFSLQHRMLYKIIAKISANESNQRNNVTEYLARNGEVYYVFKTMTFDGTKEELIDLLYNKYCTKISTCHDCTGEWFTHRFQVGRRPDGTWRVLEVMHQDI